MTARLRITKIPAIINTVLAIAFDLRLPSENNTMKAKITLSRNAKEETIEKNVAGIKPTTKLPINRINEARASGLALSPSAAAAFFNAFFSDLNILIFWKKPTFPERAFVCLAFNSIRLLFSPAVPGLYSREALPGITHRIKNSKLKIRKTRYEVGDLIVYQFNC